MVKEKHEDSDSSDDEDFCPEKEVAENSDALSSDNEEETDDNDYDEEDDDANKSSKQRSKLTTKHDTKISSSTNRRSTRQMEVEDCKSTREKDVLDDSDDEKEKSRTDALWADFLSDVQPEKKDSIKVTPSTSSTRPKTSSRENPDTTASIKAAKSSNAKDTCSVPAKTTTTVTEIADFAGEEVRVEKMVKADSIKENKTSSSNKATVGRGIPMSLKRPAASPGGGGLGGILNQIGKKKKMSVLEKTQLDWHSFKEDKGLDEELKTYNKGKDGYLERQDFLQRTDLRQFEIEKNLRQSARRTQ